MIRKRKLMKGERVKIMPLREIDNKAGLLAWSANGGEHSSIVAVGTKGKLEYRCYRDGIKLKCSAGSNALSSILASL